MRKNHCCRLEWDNGYVGIKMLPALEEIKLCWLGQDCASMLRSMGLEEGDAEAVGSNAALVYLATDMEFKSPMGVLESISLADLADIAGMVRRVHRGELEGDVAG